MKVRIFINLRASILDIQGKAVQNSLKNLGFDNIESVRQNKVVEIEFSHKVSDEDVKNMCKKLLVNDIMEDYKYEILE